MKDKLYYLKQLFQGVPKLKMSKLSIKGIFKKVKQIRSTQVHNEW